MKVELKLFASLRCHIPGNIGSDPWIADIEEGTTIRELLELSEVPPDTCKIIFVNGIHAQDDEILKDGDRVGIFPPVAGG